MNHREANTQFSGCLAPISRAQGSFEASVDTESMPRFELSEPVTKFHQGWHPDYVPCCTSCSITSAIEIMLKEKGEIRKLSPLYNYNSARGNTSTLTGLDIQQALSSINQHGLCQHSFYAHPKPANQRMAPADTNHNINEAAQADAKNISIPYDPALGVLAYEKIKVQTSRNWIEPIANGSPVIFSFYMTQAYRDISKESPFLNYNYEPTARYSHAVIAFGYNQTEGYFNVWDSRGIDFGDNGNWRLRFSDMGERRFIREAFFIKELTISY